MPSHLLSRRALLAGAGTTIASAALAVPYVNAAHKTKTLSVEDRLEHHIEGLRAALAEIEASGAGPVRAVVGSDHGAVIEPLAGAPFQRGVPPTLWRVEKPIRTA